MSIAKTSDRFESDIAQMKRDLAQLVEGDREIAETLSRALHMLLRIDAKLDDQQSAINALVAARLCRQ
ncbi:hypothetical protein [Azospirillum rugosum]|uniref:Uncharacterized protein n=1 Tax=Azospirillum rugosum TaxID=416170 RepID=A0ABS4SK91_9PROT|nr:hypothetical protein [Azospirillum rugosum]MBP2292372.1 hypothetical protein [Azospirillum rugosum]MDQ0526131.1 hypothetical protein [Azospirillum rugosum]